MRRTIGRRALFFLITSLICVSLVPATPADLRWVNWFAAALGGFWTILLAADELSSPRPERSSPRRLRHEEGTPFAPPPPPGTVS